MSFDEAKVRCVNSESSHSDKDKDFCEAARARAGAGKEAILTAKNCKSAATTMQELQLAAIPILVLQSACNANTGIAISIPIVLQYFLQCR